MKKIMFMLIVSMFFSLFANDGEKDFTTKLAGIMEKKGIEYEFLTEDEANQIPKDAFVQNLTEEEFVEFLEDLEEDIKDPSSKSYVGVYDLVCSDRVWINSNMKWPFHCTAYHMGTLTGAYLDVYETNAYSNKLWSGFTGSDFYVSDYLYNDGHGSTSNYFPAKARGYVVSYVWNGWFWQYVLTYVGNTETTSIRNCSGGASC